MNQSIIINGPTMCGKTYHAKALAKHFGLNNIVELDEQHKKEINPLDTLYLTFNLDIKNTKTKVIGFYDAMEMAGLKPYGFVGARTRAKELGWDLRLDIGGGPNAALVPLVGRKGPTLVFPNKQKAFFYMSFPTDLPQ